VKFVLSRLGPVSCLVKEPSKVNLEGQFKIIIDLRVGSESHQQLIEDTSNVHLECVVELHVTAEALQVQVQYQRKKLEDDALMSILQPKTFGLVLVLAIQSFYRMAPLAGVP
jgi:hypothetical protein